MPEAAGKISKNTKTAINNTQTLRKGNLSLTETLSDEAIVHAMEDKNKMAAARNILTCCGVAYVTDESIGVRSELLSFSLYPS